MNERFAFLNSNDGNGLLAFGVRHELRLASFDGEKLQEFIDQHEGCYRVFTIAYDSKNAFESLQSCHGDRIAYPDVVIWVPEEVASIKKGQVEHHDPKLVQKALKFLGKAKETSQVNIPVLRPSTQKDRYLKQFCQIQAHLQQGDLYEMNYCQEFHANDVLIPDPEIYYFQLNERSKAPFSAYLSIDEFRVYCCSPERFLKKTGSTLLSQPIKGTAPRGINNMDDEQLKTALANDPKERSENIMIVDLVRNDMARIAQKGSVRVDELCAIHTFETVHQMISSISCEIREDISFTAILRALFPMGSMTGAPKISSMQIAEDVEDFKRGLYSGTIGYIDPKGDFDSNVVIRTVIHNLNSHTISCGVGSAITISSQPEIEYRECLTKIRFVQNPSE